MKSVIHSTLEKRTSLALLTLATTVLSSGAAVLVNPVITSSATPFNASFVAGNLFDGLVNEFASQGGGAGAAFSTTGGTWVQMDFGSAVTMDRMILVTRGNNFDVIGTSRLILSNDPTFSAADTIFTFSPSGQNGQGLIQSFSATSARYARWEVATSTGTSQNLGGLEMRFLDTPVGSTLAPASVIGGATPFNANFALANAANGDAGRGFQAGVEYASASLGAGMFVDFDFGATVPINGFDFFDRLPGVDRTTGFNLIFSNDPTFGTTIGTQSYAPGSTGWGYGQNFAAVNARYARLDATSVVGATNNSGIQEILFYRAIPEPSAAVLALLGLAFLARRRR